MRTRLLHCRGRAGKPVALLESVILAGATIGMVRSFAMPKAGWAMDRSAIEFDVQ